MDYYYFTQNNRLFVASVSCLQINCVYHRIVILVKLQYNMSFLGLCYPSNLLLEYSASTIASTRELDYSRPI